MRLAGGGCRGRPVPQYVQSPLVSYPASFLVRTAKMQCILSSVFSYVCVSCRRRPTTNTRKSWGVRPWYTGVVPPRARAGRRVSVCRVTRHQSSVDCACLRHRCTHCTQSFDVRAWPDMYRTEATMTVRQRCARPYRPIVQCSLLVVQLYVTSIPKERPTKGGWASDAHLIVLVRHAPLSWPLSSSGPRRSRIAPCRERGISMPSTAVCWRSW